MKDQDGSQFWCHTSVYLQPVDLAEYVLNKCITQAEPRQKGSHTETENQSVKYNFDFLEDEIPHGHILVWMVSN